MKRSILAFAATMVLTQLVAQPALAQDKWPSRPIKLIVPFAAGGNTDAVARITAAQMQKALGVNVVIENKGGAGGIVGTDAAAKSAPDGYTFCVCSIGSITIAPATEKLPYDPLADIVPISLLNTNPLILLVNPGVKANSVKELIALAKAEPDKLNYSSSGLGGLMYFSAELFKAKTGTKMTHVPYRGGAPATTAVIAGEVQLVFTNMSDAVGQLDSGKVRALTVTTSKRSPSAPNVPTLAESRASPVTTPNPGMPCSRPRARRARRSTAWRRSRPRWRRTRPCRSRWRTSAPSRLPIRLLSSPRCCARKPRYGATW
jgi:tripartite-type tricarboxylate transporter receptor subunit TctC